MALSPRCIFCGDAQESWDCCHLLERVAWVYLILHVLWRAAGVFFVMKLRILTANLVLMSISPVACSLETAESVQ